MSTPMATVRRARLNPLAAASAAWTALIVRLALRAARFDRVTTVARWLAGTTRRTATTDEVLRVLHAIDVGSAWVPVRVACLERSLTAVALLAARRRGVTWQMGVRTPPLAAHAWLVDATGKPIGEPSTTAAYRPLLTIPAPTTSNRSMT